MQVLKRQQVVIVGRISIMNNIVKCFVCVLAVTSNLSFAQVSKDKRISFKCFVDLYGGSQTITNTTVKESKARNLYKTMVNSRIFVPGKEKKQQIYKVHECVPLNGEFKSGIAKTLDKQTPR